MAKPLTRRQRQLQDDIVIHATNVVKVAALLVLRNQGWGLTRLTRFSNRFDELLDDINDDRLTFSDIMMTLSDETGVGPKHFTWRI